MHFASSLKLLQLFHCFSNNLFHNSVLSPSISRPWPLISIDSSIRNDLLAYHLLLLIMFFQTFELMTPDSTSVRPSVRRARPRGVLDLLWSHSSTTMSSSTGLQSRQHFPERRRNRQWPRWLRLPSVFPGRRIPTPELLQFTRTPSSTLAMTPERSESWAACLLELSKEPFDNATHEHK